MNLAGLVEIHARSRPEHPAIHGPASTLSWKEVSRESGRLAAGMAACGVREGDRVAFLLTNSVEAVLCYIAAWKLGAIAVPLNTRWGKSDYEFVVRDIEPSMFLAEKSFLGAVPELTGDCELVVVATADDEPYTDSEVKTFASLKASEPLRIPCSLQSNAVSDITYSSGTTGEPKGVLHTHGYHLATGLGLADYFSLDQDDVGCALSPLFHVSGQTVMGISLALGTALVVLPRWEMKAFLKAVEQHSVSYMHLITTVLSDIVSSYRSGTDAPPFDTSSMRVTITGGGSSSHQLLEDYETVVGGWACEGYGRTEGGQSWNPASELRRRGSNGLVLKSACDIEVRAPDSNHPLPAGETGEIWVRGDAVSIGYWNRPDLNEGLLSEGWMATGDSGRFDEEGFLYFEGRVDHMIKTGGENVYPAEVESVLLDMPGIEECAVVGVADDRLGQRVGVVVVSRDSSLTASDVVDWARERLPGYRRPRAALVTDSPLPKLGSQKVDYKAAAELLQRSIEDKQG